MFLLMLVLVLVAVGAVIAWTLRAETPAEKVRRLAERAKRRLPGHGFGDD